LDQFFSQVATKLHSVYALMKGGQASASPCF